MRDFFKPYFLDSANNIYVIKIKPNMRSDDRLSVKQIIKMQKIMPVKFITIFL